MVVPNHGVNDYQIQPAGRHRPSPWVLSTIVNLLAFLLLVAVVVVWRVENSLPPFAINQFSSQ